MPEKKQINKKDELLRKEAKELIESIHLTDKQEEEELKDIFNDMENGELKELLERFKSKIIKDKEKIKNI